MSMEEKFRAAVRVIHSLPKDGPYQPSNSTKIKFYGLYKQATEGKINVSKPGFWDVIGRAKWEAWNKNGSLSKDEAMSEYVEGLKEIVETMSFNGEVEDFLDSIGPFYEFVTLQGNEMNHIKEKLDEVSGSSGSGSSLANSLVPSVENSKNNSPLKAIENGNENEDEEEEEEVSEVSTSEKAEIVVATSTATYESKAAKSHYSSQNGSAVKIPNGDYRNSRGVNPPPAPVHTYPHQNGFVKQPLSNETEEDEVLTVTSPAVPCKEDLEREVDEDNNGHHRVKITSSVETVASVATSGTESEKYYSGDSEPDFDDKYISSLISTDCYPSTSAAAAAQSNNGSQQQQQQHSVDGSSILKNKTNSPLKKTKISPKTSFAISKNGYSSSHAVDVVLQQTVERLNRDVDHILARLRILEAAYAANADGAIRVSPSQQPRRRIIFGDLSPQSIAFIVM